MLKQCTSLLRSAFLLSAAIILCGCSESLSDSSTDNQPSISIQLSQGANTTLVPEDPTFHALLNTTEEIEISDIPAPKVWHKITYNQESGISILVNNCPALDLLDLITYSNFDSQGRPREYEYNPICGPESPISCHDPQTLPSPIQRKLRNPDIKNFAFSGICINRNDLEPISFITFLKKN